MKIVLSTKKLSEKLEKMFLEKDIKIIQHNFISTETIDCKIPHKYDNWIFTSKNAVNAVFSSETVPSCRFNCFCVGKKTKRLLLKKGQKVKKMAKNSKKLMFFIKKNQKNGSFLYFRGSIKNNEFSDFFKKNNLILKELVVYKTILTPERIDEKLDCIMFFSPSGIKSFRKKNSLKNVICFCIGKTTLEYLNLFTENAYTVKSPSIKNVVKKTIKFLS